MKAYKAVWVSKEDGKRYSVMAGNFYFYDPVEPWTKSPLEYVEGQTIQAVSDMKPYLFAFETPTDAVTFIRHEYKGHFHQNRYVLNKFVAREGHVEIWEVEVEEYDLASQRKDIKDEIVFGARYTGTVFCKSIKLIKRLANLKQYVT